MKHNKILLIVCIFCYILVNSGSALNYLKYKELSESDRANLVKKYVRKDRDGFWMVSVSVYSVKTTVSPEFALEMAIMMDDFYKKFNEVFIGGVKLRQKPQLYVLKDRAEYARFLLSKNINASWSIGMYIHRGRCLVTFKNDHSTLTNILFHEGTHQLLHAYIGNNIPVWFNEGMATNFETWNVYKSEMRNVKEALYRSGRARVISTVYGKSGFISLAQLMSITSRQWLASQDPQVQYAAAWSAVNFLLNTKDGRKILNLLLTNFKKGRKQKQILSSKFISVFETKWKADLEARIIPHVRYGQKIMMLINQKNIKHAKKLHNEFYKKHPGNAEALMLSGVIALQEDRSEQALESLKKAAEKEPHEPNLNYYLGAAYYKNHNRSSALRFLKKARKEDPFNADIKKLMEKIQNDKNIQR